LTEPSVRRLSCITQRPRAGGPPDEVVAPGRFVAREGIIFMLSERIG
jgi:hypothetical protein